MRTSWQFSSWQIHIWKSSKYRIITNRNQVSALEYEISHIQKTQRVISARVLWRVLWQYDCSSQVRDKHTNWNHSNIIIHAHRISWLTQNSMMAHEDTIMAVPQHFLFVTNLIYQYFTFVYVFYIIYNVEYTIMAAKSVTNSQMKHAQTSTPTTQTKNMWVPQEYDMRWLRSVGSIKL